MPEHYHPSYYSLAVREARKNLQHRKPGWGQDSQRLPHKAHMLQLNLILGGLVIRRTQFNIRKLFITLLTFFFF